LGALRERAADLVTISDTQGLPLFRGFGRVYHGLARITAGEGADAPTEVVEGLTLTAGTGTGAGFLRF